MKVQTRYRVRAMFTRLRPRYFRTMRQAGAFVSRNINRGLLGRPYLTEKIRVRVK